MSYRDNGVKELEMRLDCLVDVYAAVEHADEPVMVRPFDNDHVYITNVNPNDPTESFDYFRELKLIKRFGTPKTSPENWISVEDELPGDCERVVAYHGEWDEVFGAVFFDKDQWEVLPRQRVSVDGVTHWARIEQDYDWSAIK